jgi:hypothetical protein
MLMVLTVWVEPSESFCFAVISNTPEKGLLGTGSMNIPFTFGTVISLSALSGASGESSLQPLGAERQHREMTNTSSADRTMIDPDQSTLCHLFDPVV